MDRFCLTLVALLAMASTVLSKPIMVSYGTNQGPIVPRPPTTARPARPEEVRAPAPVSERADDVPNPSAYRAPVPQQYRSNFLSFRPSPDLVVGGPRDKYLSKFAIWKQQQARESGVQYRGPHYFEVQDYELERPRVPLFRPIQKPYEEFRAAQRRGVPEIGVIYSAGVRYYVPQLVYQEEQENEVDPGDRYYYKGRD